MKLTIHAEYTESIEFEMGFTDKVIKDMDDGCDIPFLMDRVIEESFCNNGNNGNKHCTITAYNEYGDLRYEKEYI